MGYTPIPTAICMILGALFQDPTASQELQRPADPACLSFARVFPSPAFCVGPFCKPCYGSCKIKCGPNETSGAGYCGKRCQCCKQIISPLCLHGASCGKGGNCRSGISCPKNEKPISGTCGHAKNCICCAPDRPLGVKPGGCPLLPAAPPGSSTLDNTDPASGCQGDMDCPGVQKCCAQGICCARSCMNPCDTSLPWCIGK